MVAVRFVGGEGEMNSNNPVLLQYKDEGEWRRTAGQGAEHFMAKWIAAEKARAGQRHAVVCPNVTGITKERI